MMDNLRTTTTARQPQDREAKALTLTRHPPPTQSRADLCADQRPRRWPDPPDQALRLTDEPAVLPTDL